jgi:hypothetical protein
MATTVFTRSASLYPYHLAALPAHPTVEGVPMFRKGLDLIQATPEARKLH